MDLLGGHCRDRLVHQDWPKPTELKALSYADVVDSENFRLRLEMEASRCYSRDHVVQHVCIPDVSTSGRTLCTFSILPGRCVISPYRSLAASMACKARMWQTVTRHGFLSTRFCNHLVGLYTRRCIYVPVSCIAYFARQALVCCILGKPVSRAILGPTHSQWQN